MPTTAQITLWLVVLATLLALACVILVAINVSQKPVVNCCNSGCTGCLTGSTAEIVAAALDKSWAGGGGPNTEQAFGNGSVGDALFEGQTGLVLSYDAHYRNLTLNGSVLDTNGYRLFVSDTLTLTGGSVVSNRGAAGLASAAVQTGGWVDGGWGAPAGTLGGGGDGGYGALLSALATGTTAEELLAEMSGGPSLHALWGHDTSLFAGANATTSPLASEYQQAGLGGAVASDRVRVSYELVQALNPKVTPRGPLLSGGSGGGGGHGFGSNAGSGGGGGGGVVLIAAKHLIVPQHSGATIDVSGANAGTVAAGCCSTTTSGGGGGGGLVVIATLSPPTSYAGLVLNVSGGAGVDQSGQTVAAAPGRAMFWFNADPTAASGANPNAYLTAVCRDAQPLPSGVATSLAFHDTVGAGLGILFDPSNGSVTVASAGLYSLSASIALTPGINVAAWFRRNEDDAVQLGTGQVCAPAVGTAGAQFLALAHSLHLEAGDSVDIRLLQASGTDAVVGGFASSPTTFNIILTVPQFGSS